MRARAVWKFPFSVYDSFALEMPSRHEVIHVDLQGGVAPTMWALVDPSSPKAHFTFFMHRTGHPVAEDLRHVGTFRQGPYMWHLFTTSAYRGFDA